MTNHAPVVGRIAFPPAESQPPPVPTSSAQALPAFPGRLPAVALAPAVACRNDNCREYRKLGRRRHVGRLLPGCEAQCRSCGTWYRR